MAEVSLSLPWFQLYKTVAVHKSREVDSLHFRSHSPFKNMNGTFALNIKNSNKQIIHVAMAQAVSDYNVGHLEGYVRETLSSPLIKITTNHLQLQDRKPGAMRQKKGKKKENAPETVPGRGVLNICGAQHVLQSLKGRSCKICFFKL